MISIPRMYPQRIGLAALAAALLAMLTLAPTTAAALPTCADLGTNPATAVSNAALAACDALDGGHRRQYRGSAEMPLRRAQNFPHAYDGILAGAPASWETRIASPRRRRRWSTRSGMGL